MDTLEFIQNRIHRANLDTTKYYIQMKAVGGTKTVSSTYVGQFVRVYRMGSGDGMTLHLEFNNNGRIVKIDEEMWGSTRGDELSYFIETRPVAD